VLITNKVTTHFFITPFKPISYTLHATPLAGSRYKFIEPLAKLRVDERQSHLETIFGLEWAAWWFHGAKFQPGNGPKWGSRSPLMSFARGSIAYNLSHGFVGPFAGVMKTPQGVLMD